MQHFFHLKIDKTNCFLRWFSHFLPFYFHQVLFVAGRRWEFQLVYLTGLIQMNNMGSKKEHFFGWSYKRNVLKNKSSTKQKKIEIETIEHVENKEANTILRKSNYYFQCVVSHTQSKKQQKSVNRRRREILWIE